DLGPYGRAHPRRERSLVRVLADRALDRADHTWLVFDEGRSLTFAEAHSLTSRVGHAVAGTVGRDAHVALFLRNQVEFMPSFLGPMAAGGATVPLNADARGPLLEYVLAKSDARLLVARDDLLDRLAELGSLGRGGLRPAGGGLGAGAGAARRRARRRLRGVAGRAAGRSPGAPTRPRRGGAHPVHLGHHGTLQGGGVPPPLPLPLLGDGLRLARAQRRRRAHDAAPPLPRGRAPHHRQLGAPRRLHRAPALALLGVGVLPL